MFANNPFLQYVARQFVAVIGVVGLFYILVMLLIWIFRVKNPSIRYLLLTVPLIKGLFTLIHEPVSAASRYRGVLFFYVRFSDPSTFSSNRYADALNGALLLSANRWYIWPTVLLIVTAIAFLIWRAYGLWQFNKLLSRSPEVATKDQPTIHAALNELSQRAAIKKPKLVVAATSAAPFTVGVLKPVIVLSPSLIANLTGEEMRSVLAHEIAHIARRDYLYHWMIVSLRDVMYFNPLTHLIYRRLNFEKERACDRLALNFTDGSLSLAKGLVKVAELRLTEPAYAFTKSFAPQNLIKDADLSFSARVGELLEPAVLSRVNLFRKMIIIIGIFLLLYVEIHLGILLLKPALILS